MPILPLGSIRDEPLPPKKPPQFNKKTTPPLLGIFLLLFLALLSITYIAFRNMRDSQLAAKVGSQIITKNASEKFARDCNIEAKDALEYLVDDRVLSLWAADEKVEVTPEEVNVEKARLRELGSDICDSLRAKVNILREKLYENEIKFRQGQIIVVNFDRYNPNPVVTIVQVSSESEREQKLKLERQYADKLVQSIYNDLKSGQLTFEEAIEKVKADPKVGMRSPYATSLQSGPFTATDYIEKRNLLSYDSVRKIVDSLSESHFSEPFVQQINSSPCGTQEPGCVAKFIDSRWLILKVDKIGKGYEKKGQDLLEEIRKKYQATIY